MIVLKAIVKVLAVVKFLYLIAELWLVQMQMNRPPVREEGR